MNLPILRQGDPPPGAAWLNAAAEASRRLEQTTGTHSSIQIPPMDGPGRIPIVVIARTIAGQSPGENNTGAFLADHQYTVAGHGQEWSVNHRQLIVAVQPELIDVLDPEKEEQLFTPAAVAGDGVSVKYPWRARGWLERFVAPSESDEDGVRGYGVMLYGLAPHRGC